MSRKSWMNWLRALALGPVSSRIDRPHRRPELRQRRPWLEVLEDRLAPAIAVTYNPTGAVLGLALQPSDVLRPLGAFEELFCLFDQCPGRDRREPQQMTRSMTDIVPASSKKLDNRNDSGPW